jgi:hypothetical protein
MILATPRINEFAERLYMRFARNDTLSPDARAADDRSDYTGSFGA